MTNINIVNSLKCPECDGHGWVIKADRVICLLCECEVALEEFFELTIDLNFNPSKVKK